MENAGYQNPTKPYEPALFEGLFQLKPGVHLHEIGDALTFELKILCAMLLNTHGASFEGFNGMCDESKENLLAGAFRSAVKCSELAEILHDRVPYYGKRG